MTKKKVKKTLGMLSFALLALTMSTSVFAASWTTNLDRWSMEQEIGEITKQTTNTTYYMQVDYVGSTYDSVEHWIESDITGSNYSVHTITKEGFNSSPASSAKVNDEVVLNVKNPVNASVQVAASGAWSPN